MKVYARCVWHEGNDQLEEEETLLGTWVDEKNHTIRWPTRVNVLRALREMRDPEPHWKTFTLIKVKLWSNSIRECDEYNFTTSGETEDDENTAESAKIPTKEFHTKQNSSIISKVALSESPASPDTFKSILKRPKINSISNSTHTHRTVEKKEISSQNKHRTEDPIDYTPPPKKAHTEKVKTPLSGKSASRIPTDNERNVTHSPAGSSSWLLSKPNKSKFPLQEANYQYRTISLLVEILETLKKMSTGMDVEGDEDVQVCGSFEELDEFESILSQNTHRKKILKNLSKIGGQQFEENTRNVMRKLMSNGLMSQMNKDGQRGKRRFLDFERVLELIKDAVLINFPPSSDGTPKVTGAQVEKYMGMVLKRAPDRKGGAGRPEKVDFEKENVSDQNASDQNADSEVKKVVFDESEE